MIEKNILKIDLSGKSYCIDEIPQEIIDQYIGGRGLGSYLLTQSVPAQADPLGEENHIIFTAGPASGSGLFFSSKVNVNTKSPLTGIYLYSISSGTLAHQMKKAGYWAIDIRGRAATPTYLAIKNENILFQDASRLWGQETAKAQQIMLGNLSPKKAATVGIGPAGEQMNPYAALFTEGGLYRCFGRGGTGAVMGSKNLKGMVISGDGDISIGDLTCLDKLKKEHTRLLKSDLKGWADHWRQYETAADLATMDALGALPSRNWQGGTFEGWQGIDKSTTPMGWPDKGRPCGPYCPAPGCREVEVKDGPYKGARSDFEWETIYALGSNCGVDQMEAIVAASQICDEYGVDTMTAGVTIGFAMECFEKGLINKKDTQGIDLRFGNHQAMVEVLRQMAKGEGFGKEIAKGSRRLSREIKGSEGFAMQVKGMELGGYECRGLNGQALQFAIDNRGGCHHGYGLPARVESTDGSRLDITGKGAFVKNEAVSRIIRDSMIVCTFTPLYDIKMVAETLSALTGKTCTPEELEKIGARIMCRERYFNMREGLTEKDDTLPLRLLKEPKPDGPAKGYMVPLKELKEDYYKAMGYDLSTGNPGDELLTKLGIKKD